MNDTLTAQGDLWWRLTDTDREDVKTWLTDHGIDPNQTFAVRLTAEGAIEADCYRLNHRGKKYLDTNGEPATYTATVAVPYLPDAWPL